MIYVIDGPPRTGKTAYGTKLALKFMRDANCKNVFTNWPVHSMKLRRKTKIWRREYIFEPIFDSVIIIDEAHKWYPSRGSQAYNKNIKAPGLTHQEHIKFATCGHDGLDIYFITQNIARLDLVICEMLDVYYRCKAIRFPEVLPLIGDRLINLKVTGYSEVENKKIKDAEEIYSDENSWLPGLLSMRDAFNAYNTHYFRSKGQMRPVFDEWTSDITGDEYMRSQIGDDIVIERK